MCLHLFPEQKNKIDFGITKEDFVVYKILTFDGMNLFSPYKFFTYKLGKLYKQQSPKFPEWNGKEDKIINRGYHYFLTLGKARARAKNCPHYKIYKCIIPKGSCYYDNFYYLEGCANQIIIKKLIK